MPTPRSPSSLPLMGINTDMRMAGARSVNTDVIDAHLVKLIEETKTIESQVDALLKKLRDLRVEIMTQSATVGMPMQAHVEKATFKPLPIIKMKPQVILPVPERISVQKPATKPKMKIVQKTPKLVLKSGVVGVRTGVHKDKTRLVFDVNGSTAHKVDFDKEIGVLTISFAQTPWATASGKAYRFSQLAGYEAKNSGKGSIIALSVKNTSRVKTSKIAKTGSKPARLIIDLLK